MILARLRIIPRHWRHCSSTLWFSRAKTTMQGLDLSPPPQRWMKDALNRDVFKKHTPILAAKIPTSKTGVLINSKVVSSSLLGIPRMRNVVHDPSNPHDRLVLFRVTDEAKLSPEARNFVLQEGQGQFTDYTLELDYDYWTADDILHAILPEELCDGAPAGFAATGHLAHLNLNAPYLPYKYIIGQVIMDKNPRIRTVVNKLESISNQFRVFQMELLAGNPDYIVEHAESNCIFKFDFSTVYWNSRLGTEHARLPARYFTPGAVVADVFAGVGPFAVPAAKNHGCAVLANDLNPESARWLRHNAKVNHVAGDVRVLCEDGREFIATIAQRVVEDPFPPYTGPKISRRKEREAKKAQSKGDASGFQPSMDFQSENNLPNRNRIDHFVMNLPDSAIEFLDAFRGLYTKSHELARACETTVVEALPMIHCYCFTRELEREDAEVDIRNRVEERLGSPLDVPPGGLGEDLHWVRRVAPNKDMYCISFRLPASVAYRDVGEVVMAVPGH